MTARGGKSFAQHLQEIEQEAARAASRCASPTKDVKKCSQIGLMGASLCSSAQGAGRAHEGACSAR